MPNLRTIMSALKEVSTRQKREEILEVTEQKLHLLGKKLSFMEEEYKQLDELVQTLKRMD
jgi:hypothetical protein